MKLHEFVEKHAERGACCCGQCVDAPKDPKKQQPAGHTINLTFFKVAKKGNPHKNEMLALVKQEFPHWLDGKEHSYLEVGADVGDQGIALMTIGLGHLLGLWHCLCPETMTPFLPDEMKQMMAGKGLVCLQEKQS
jgi:hypothetical protein